MERNGAPRTELRMCLRIRGLGSKGFEVKGLGSRFWVFQLLRFRFRPAFWFRNCSLIGIIPSARRVSSCLTFSGLWFILGGSSHLILLPIP